MGLILRSSSLANPGNSVSVKGSVLEYTEGDGNFMYLLTNMSGSTISITGSTGIVGSLTSNGNVTFTGLANSSATNIVTYNSSTGRLFYLATGSLTAGTASFVSSSNVYGPNGFNSILSSSYALSASYALNATSASYTLSSSYALNATSASYALSSSYALSASYALNSTNSQTASYVNPLTQSVIISGSTILTGSLNITGSTFINTLPTTPQSNIVTYNSSTGQLFYSTNDSLTSSFAPTSYYGSFYHNTSIIATATTTPTTMSLNTTDFAFGVNISGSSNDKIKFASGGRYDIQFSAQFTKNTGTSATVYIWLRKNGTDVAWSNTGVTLAGGANDVATPAWNWFVSASANDYYQLMWSTSNTNTFITASNSVGGGPEVPALIVTVNRVG